MNYKLCNTLFRDTLYKIPLMCVICMLVCFLLILFLNRNHLYSAFLCFFFLVVSVSKRQIYMVPNTASVATIMEKKVGSYLLYVASHFFKPHTQKFHGCQFTSASLYKSYY